MKLLLVFGTVLTAIFGFSLAMYFVNYKTKLTNPILKVAGLLTLGTILTAATLIIAIIAVWPPIF